MKLCHVVCCDLYALRYIMNVIKSMRMRWTGHVARMAEKENASRTRWVNLKERPLGGPRRR